MTRALALIVLLMSSLIPLTPAAFAGPGGGGSHGGGGSGGASRASSGGGHMSFGGHATGTHVVVSGQPQTATAKDARIATVAPPKPPRPGWWQRHFKHDSSTNSNTHNPVESWCVEKGRSDPECAQSARVPNAPAVRR